MEEINVLVVDDETAIADLVEFYLKNENYRVCKCNNGADAIESLAHTEFQLAVLDVMLPDMDGFAICRRIREKHFFPIIMLTAKVEDMDKIMGLTIGADDYITKPFNPLELVARVKTQLRRYRRYNQEEKSLAGSENASQGTGIPGAENASQGTGIPGSESASQGTGIPGSESASQSTGIPGSENASQGICTAGAESDMPDRFGNEYDFAGLVINKDSHKAALYGKQLTLTPTEFSILWYLCESRGRVVSAEELFEAVWGEKFLDNNNTVMAHVARLREKMGEPPRRPKFIKTVWGVGYTIEA